MSTYILVDTANLFFRARHIARGDADLKIGMAMYVTFTSVRKLWKQFNADHVVFCFEGRSWRKDHYAPYKRNRTEQRASLTESEAEEEKIFWEAFDDLKEFVHERTNCTYLQHPELEADDLIAGWIEHHPDDQHIIVSTDGDFVQLVRDNVKLYNGTLNRTIGLDGIFDDKGVQVIDKKTGKPVEVPDPDWELFFKCIRGDQSDNVFSAYPGARVKGTTKKIGMREAFEDRKSKGYNWNNFMLQRWTDHEGKEHRVLDDYSRNVLLCDLHAQPKDIKEKISIIINQSKTPKTVSQIGVRVLKFTGKWDLPKMAEQIDSYMPAFNSSYPLNV